MALQVHTNDAAALTDTDLDELATIGGAFDIGVMSKAKEEWVLITTARFDGKLHGFMFSTLERIGGTPCVLIGLLSVKRTSKTRNGAARADERGVPPCTDGVPRRGRRDRLAFRHRRRPGGVQGDERRHAEPGIERRRRGAGLGSSARQAVRRRWRYEARSFTVKKGGQDGFLDLELPSRPKSNLPCGRCSMTSSANAGAGKIVYGWMMAEELVKLGQPQLATSR